MSKWIVFGDGAVNLSHISYFKCDERGATFWNARGTPIVRITPSKGNDRPSFSCSDLKAAVGMPQDAPDE